MTDAPDRISIYTWPTANCLKVQIALEELSLPHEIRPIDILAGEHRAPAFGALDPNRRVPVLSDPAGPDGARIVVADSAAALIYLAEKTERLLPQDPALRSEALQWLAFQAGGLSTFCGEAIYYRHHAPERWPYAIERYTREAARHFRVIESRLESRNYIAGTYSIADIAIFPWIRIAASLGQDIGDFPLTARWHSIIAERAPVRRAIDALQSLQRRTEEGGAAIFSYTPEAPESVAP